MDKEFYNCQYCGTEYKPKRRFKQRFCSNSCRANSFKRNKLKSQLGKTVDATENKNPAKIEKMSWAGVGNAAAGAVVVNTVAHLFTKEENRPATKKDIKEIISVLKQRYFVVKNMNQKPDGSVPYFDIQTSLILYFKPNKIVGYGNK